MLTDKEITMVKMIGTNDFQNGEADEGNAGKEIWADCLDSGPYGNTIHPTSFGGLIASLTKKGLVRGQGDGRDALIWFTPKGVEAYLAIKDIKTNRWNTSL